MKDDVISRQAAIDYFVTNVGFHDEDGYPIKDEEELREIWAGYFDGIPSAQPEKRTKERTKTHACDSISRQQAIDALEEQLDYLQTLNKDENPTAESKWYGVNWARNTIAEFPSAQPDLLDDGTILMTVPHGILSDVKRVLVDEVGTKFCKTMYQDEPEQEILDELMDIMKEYYFTHRYEYDEAWENGFAKCMNLIPNVYMKRGKDR